MYAVLTMNNPPLSRCVLLFLLIMAAGGVPIIENPVSTLLFAHPRFLYLVALLKDRGISQLATVIYVAFFLNP